MLRFDLEAAGIPYEVPGPDGQLFADFHALRHTYLTLGGRAGIDLRTLQELAGHSSPALTARYSHRRLHDLAGAVEKLPPLLPGRAGETLAATGTDPAARRRPRLDQTAANPCVSLRTHENASMRAAVAGTVRNPLEIKAVGNDCERLRSDDAGVGDGIRTHDFQIHRRAANQAPGLRNPCDFFTLRLPILSCEGLRIQASCCGKMRFFRGLRGSARKPRPRGSAGPGGTALSTAFRSLAGPSHQITPFQEAGPAWCFHSGQAARGQRLKTGQQARYSSPDRPARPAGGPR
jgi:hypothetical protein